MEDTADRIEQAGVGTQNALEISRKFFRSMDDNYTVTPIKHLKNDAKLVDPTYITLTPPTQPAYQYNSNAFPKIPTPTQFTSTLPLPPTFSGGSESMDFSESKTTWLLDISGGNSTRDAIRELFDVTGFEDVEIDSYELGTERDAQALRDAEEAIISRMAGRGFGLPSDITNMMIEKEVMQPYEAAQFKKNIDIFVQESGRAQKQAQFGITAGLDAEEMLWNYASRMAARSLDAAMTIAAIGLLLFNAKTRQYNAELKGNRVHMEGVVDVEESQINNYKEILQADEERLRAYVTAVSLVKNNYRSALRGYKAEMRSEGERASVVMSWRKGQWRENLAKIVAELDVDTVNMMALIEKGRINTHVDTATAMYYVHYLSALLSSLQVVIDESQAYEENVIV